MLNGLLAKLYALTHGGYSYSKSFLHAIVLVGLTVALIMVIIGSDIARAFALVGAMSIIRFRTPVKDIRDIVFLFLAVANGIACGAGAFNIALAGVLGADIICLILYTTRFGGTRRAEDLLVKINFDPVAFASEGVTFEGILEKYCDSLSFRPAPGRPTKSSTAPG